MVDIAYDKLQETVKNAEEAYNKTVQVLTELGIKGIKKVWIGTNEGLTQFVTSDSLYTHKDTGYGKDCQHNILSNIGVGTGCSNGNGDSYQTQIKKNSLVYGIYELTEEGWIRK